MNLELKKLGDIVENRVDHDRYNEIPRLEPASAAIRLNNRELLKISGGGKTSSDSRLSNDIREFQRRN